MSVVKKLVVVFVVLVVVATTGVIFSHKPTAAQADGPKWYDRFSQCEHDCPSLDFPTCNCFVLPPIIVRG